MKRYIRSSKKYASSAIDMLKSKLGISWGSDISLIPINNSNSKCNFKLTQRYHSFTKDSDIIADLKKIGAKYITLRYGGIEFFYNLAPLQEESKRLQSQYDDEYNAELESFDIEQYKPSSADLKKLMNYRDNGSRVNVKAIKSDEKLLTYFYASCLMNWSELKSATRSALGYHYDDLCNAIQRRVAADESYSDTRTADERYLNIPNSNGLFTFVSKSPSGAASCWLPVDLLKLFIENNIAVDFGKRTSSGRYDRNGAEWSEIEHLHLTDSNNQPYNIDVVVHTNERADGSIPNTYTVIDADDNRVLGDRISKRSLIALFKELI